MVWRSKRLQRTRVAREADAETDVGAHALFANQCDGVLLVAIAP
jgi:hypothetical protein